MDLIQAIMQMQKEGYSEDQIVKTLKDNGISPKEITTALENAKVKSAVSNGDEENPMKGSLMSQNQMQNPNMQQQTNMSQENQMPNQPSIQNQMQNQNYNQSYQENNSNNYSPQNYNQSYPSENQEQSTQDYQEYYPQTPNAYSGQGNDYYMPQAGTDSGTISDISEQIAEEKVNPIRNEVRSLISFKNLSEDKLNNLDERLRRIEDTIDKLQNAIIQKIGDFGNNSELIRRDLDNLHGTVSKLMNPLIDNINELKKHNKK